MNPVACPDCFESIYMLRSVAFKPDGTKLIQESQPNKLIHTYLCYSFKQSKCMLRNKFQIRNSAKQKSKRWRRGGRPGIAASASLRVIINQEYFKSVAEPRKELKTIATTALPETSGQQAGTGGRDRVVWSSPLVAKLSSWVVQLSTNQLDVPIVKFF